MFKNRCYNGGNKHKFCPRFSTKMNPHLIELFSELSGTSRALETLKDKEYIYDICKWCGKIIDKESHYSLQPKYIDFSKMQKIKYKEKNK